jgi:hypothetical protein
VPGSAKPRRAGVSWRLLQPLENLLGTLRRADEHGNRTLFADHLLVAHLVAFFSPALKSLRRIEDVFDHPGVRRKYGLPRLPHSTLSPGAPGQALFAPELLTPLVADLKQRVRFSPHAARLDELTRKLLAVDGSFFALAPRVTWALYNQPNATPRQPQPRRRRGNVRVDFHFDVLAGVPEAAFVTGGRTPEYQTLVAHLQAGAFYVVDRAYHCYQMVADMVAAGSDVLVRLRDDMRFSGVAEEPLRAADRLAGVVAAQTVRACGARGEKALGDTPLRLVTLMGPDGQPVPRRAGADESPGPGGGSAGAGVPPPLADRAVLSVAEVSGELPALLRGVGERRGLADRRRADRDVTTGAGHGRAAQLV